MPTFWNSDSNIMALYNVVMIQRRKNVLPDGFHKKTFISDASCSHQKAIEDVYYSKTSYL
jgi:hypothetical protein